MMKQLCLYVFCLMGSLAEMASSNGVLPYPATILEGEGQVCPPEEVNNIARAKIAEDAQDITLGGHGPKQLMTIMLME